MCSRFQPTAGCRTHLLRTGKAKELDDLAISELAAQVPGTTTHVDLPAFAEWLIARDKAEADAKEAARHRP